MTPQDGITTLTDAQLERMLDRAAVRGAQEALKAVGLGDENAGQDIREVRTLLTAWRDTKRTIWQQVVKMVVTLLLAAMAAGLAVIAWTQGGRP
jgi:hypothetical protein